MISELSKNDDFIKYYNQFKNEDIKNKQKEGISMEEIEKELDKAYEDTRLNKPRAILISGPTGCGKTFIVREWLSKHKNYCEISCNTLKSGKINIFGYTCDDMLKNIPVDREIVFYEKIDCTDYNTRVEIKASIMELKQRKNVLIIATGWDEPHMGYDKFENEFLELFDTVINMKF